LRGSLPEARRHIEESIRVAATAGETEHWIRAVALQGSILHDMGEVEEAASRFAAIRAMGASPIARRGLWEAEHDLALGRHEAARDITEQNLALCTRLGWEGHLAHCHTVLGLLLASGGAGKPIPPHDEDVEAARGHLARARVWAGTTGEVEVALRCHELAARIELAAGQPEQAAQHAGGGLRLAETCGFGLWAARLGALAARSAVEADPEGAAALAMRALQAAAAEDAWGRADALHWAGVSFSRIGQRARARELLREAAALRGRIKHPEASASREAFTELP
jgi:tetratricopeptide (TPR) repeat protein